MFSRKALSRGITSLRADQWDRLYQKASGLFGRRGGFSLPGTKLHKLAGVLDAQSPLELYRRLASVNPSPENFLVKGSKPDHKVMDDLGPISEIGFEELMMYLDMVTYLPGDILTKVDRASMATSLEARVPLLDHRLVEYAWRLPLSMKIRGGEGKWALKQIVHRHVPPNIMERPKMGFSVPLAQWLRGPLRSWAEDLLNPERIEAEGYFRRQPVQRLLAEHLSGKSENEHQLWAILMFQSWVR